MSGSINHWRYTLLAVASACGLCFFPSNSLAAEIEFTVDTTVVLDDIAGTFTILTDSRADSIVIETASMTVTVASGDMFSIRANDQQRLVNTAGLEDCWPTSAPLLTISGPITITISPEVGPCSTSMTIGSDAFYKIYKNNPKSPVTTPLVTGTPPSAIYNRREILFASTSIDQALGFIGSARTECPVGDLLKGSRSTIYYCGQDGYRHTFTQEKVYSSWYGENFTSVRQIQDAQLSLIPLGRNMTYRPGLRLLKIQSDPKVYAVSGRTLRWVEDEAVAEKLYGAEWSKYVDDIADAFFADYLVGISITASDGAE